MSILLYSFLIQRSFGDLFKEIGTWRVIFANTKFLDLNIKDLTNFGSKFRQMDHKTLDRFMIYLA